MKKIAGMGASALLILAGLFVACPNNSAPGGGIDEGEVTLKSIEIKTPATKTTFNPGDEFTYEGLTLTATYSDKTTAEITDGFTVTLPEANIDSENKVKLSKENTHIETVSATVTYQDKTKSYTVTIEDDKVVLDHIKVAIADDAVTTCTVGGEPDLGITVTAYYGASDEDGDDITSAATIKLTVADGEGSKAFTTETAGTFTVTVTATYRDKTDTATVSITVAEEEAPEEDSNLITEVSVNGAFIHPGWAEGNILLSWNADNSEYVAVEPDNSVTFKLPSGLNDQWQAQLLIDTDASVAKDEYWLFSCRLSGVTGGYTIKLNNDTSLIPDQTGTITSAEEGVTVLCGGKAGGAYANMPIMFDFGTCSEGTAVISDLRFEIIDIESVVTEEVIISPATSDIYEGKSVEFSATLNGLYPIDVTFSTSEEGVSQSTVEAGVVTVGNVTGDTDGTVTVSATYKGVKGNATITVKKIEAVTDKDIFPLIGNINPNWGQAGSCEKVTLADGSAVGGYTGDVAKFTNLNYQGWDLTAFDASLYKGIAVEYYTEDLTSLSVFPINTTQPDGQKEYEITNTSITTGAWTTAKYAFAEGHDPIHSNVNQLKFVGTASNGNGNFYIKAIYFYAEEE